ncbi:hypothetical protein [Polaromonas naphthalenivorans]|uniref:hypothetical protein n=1 Tax=Polaromonas naphthalenivorans TaxID=216465 RepID=UPI00059DA457|nr:hypothetical protein [Polaromonas naphthalenivorans]
MTVHTFSIILLTEPDSLQPEPLAWLAAAVFIVSVRYELLMPLLPDSMPPMLPSATPTEVAPHVGFLSGMHFAGMPVGAPLWEAVAVHASSGRSRLWADARTVRQGMSFSALAQRSSVWLTASLVTMLLSLVTRPGWWSSIPAKFTGLLTGGSSFWQEVRELLQQDCETPWDQAIGRVRSLTVKLNF